MMQNKADMTRCTEDIMTLKNKYMRTLAHAWTDVEFVQQAVAQLLSIKAIERELRGIDETNVEFVQQAVGQLPSIETIERELQGFDGGDA